MKLRTSYCYGQVLEVGDLGYLVKMMSFMDKYLFHFGPVC